MDECNVDTTTLIDENRDLQFKINEHLDTIEDLKQQLHTAVKQIERLDLMKLNLEIENEALNGLHQIKLTLENRVITLESELSSTRLKCTNLELILKDEKDNHEAVINKLNEELTRLKDEPKEVVDIKQQQELLQTISEAQEKNQLLMEANSELQNQNKTLKDQNIILEMSLNESTREVEEMKEIIEIKSNDLKSALEQVEELQGEKAMLNVELTSFRCQPASANKRGNSLFAEVEDKRLSVATKLEAMQNKYKELKKCFLKKNAELRALEAQNIELRKRWKENENEPYKNVASLVESYKTRIQDLCRTVSILEKRPETPQIISISEVTDAHVNVIKGLVDEERNVNQQLRIEMEHRSIRELNLNQQLFDLKQGIRALKSQSMKDSAEKALLKLQIEEMKNKENIAQPTTQITVRKEVRMVE